MSLSNDKKRSSDESDEFIPWNIHGIQQMGKEKPLISGEEPGSGFQILYEPDEQERNDPFKRIYEPDSYSSDPGEGGSGDSGEGISGDSGEGISGGSGEGGPGASGKGRDEFIPFNVHGKNQSDAYSEFVPFNVDGREGQARNREMPPADISPEDRGPSQSPGQSLEPQENSSKSSGPASKSSAHSSKSSGHSSKSSGHDSGPETDLKTDNIDADMQGPREKKFQDGWSAGFEKGSQEGLEKGRQEGLDLGRREGFEQGREEGYNEGLEKGEQAGYDAGFEKGENDGRMVSDAKALELISSLEDICLKADRAWQDMVGRQEEQILSLICKIAEKVIFARVDISEDIVKESVFHALSAMPEPEDIVLNISPDDYEYIEMVKDDLFERFKSLKSVSVISNPAVNRGGCKIESSKAKVATDIESRLEAVVSSIKAAHGR
ncbi:MAG: hypothetical protein HQK66_12735 [Desulfamplus sp.]|nr:hypothetical protein [Desulfamplus sp.]